VERQIIILTDEEGQEHEFTLLDIIEVDNTEYAILASMESEEAIALRLETDDEGQQILTDIEDDEEWERVAAAWERAQHETDDSEPQ